LDAKEHDNEYEQKAVDLNFEQRVNNIVCSLEVLNVDDFAEDYIPLVEKEGANLAFDSSHDKHGADCFMYSFVDSQESEFADQPVEEQVDVPSFFLLDDIADVDDFPRYDEYNDDYEVDFPEQAIACSLSENDPVALYMENFISSDLQLDVCLSARNVQFQQFEESSKPAYFSYDSDVESGDENSLPLCFASFKLLKENFETINEVEECGLMQRHLGSFEQIDSKMQQSSRMFDDPVVDYMEGFNSQNLQPMISCKDGSKDDHELVSKPTISLLPTDVLLQQSYAVLHPSYDNHQLDLHEGKNAVGGVTHQSDNLEQCLDISLHCLEDPFAVLLEFVSGPKFSDFSDFSNVEFVCKFLNGFLVSRSFILPLRKHMQIFQPVDKVLAWLHDFT
jgi:hypothetical protein